MKEPRHSHQFSLAQTFIEVLKYYTIFCVLVFTYIFITEEAFIKNSFVRNFFLSAPLLNTPKSDIFEYFAQNQHFYSLPNEINVCNHEIITPESFLTEYVQQSKPCLLKNYAKTWPAFEKWKNHSYIIEKAGDEVVYTERSPISDKEFAYFKKKFRKEYLKYSSFIEKMQDKDRQFNYYFAQESIPQPMRQDINEPHLTSQYLRPTETAYWHGIGTVSLPHTDGDENIMCVFKGYKNFTIVSPFHSKFVYPGVTREKSKSDGEDLVMPHNYSPVNFDKPDYERYPLFKNAKTYKIHLTAGDCLYLPGIWWHQVTSSPTESIAVSTWYHSNSKLEAVVMEGINLFD